MSKHCCRALVILSLAILAATPVKASPVFDLTGDTIGNGGLQAGTVAGGSAASYFNPALLIDAPSGVSLGFMVLNQRIGIILDGRPGSEFAVPENIQNAGHADGTRFDNYPIPTNLLQYGRMMDRTHAAFVARPRQADGSGHETLTYEAVGLVVKMFDEHVALGFHALIPNGQFTTMRAFFSDEREQYFSNSLHPELYSDRMTALSMALGLGIEITKQLSVGVGATFSLKANVSAGAYVVDTSNLSNILIDMNAPVNIGIAPHFGARYKFSDRFQLSANARSPEKVELGTGFKFLLANAIEQASGVPLLLDYTPWQVGLGGSFDVIKESTHTLSLAASVQYAAWHTYLDRHDARPLPGYGWSDTLSPTLGVRYQLQRLTTALDLTYVPTPVPLQTGRTNYVDNDRIGGSVGAQYHFPALGTELSVGANVQVHRLIPRHQQKLPTPTQPDGANTTPSRVKDELPDDAQLGGDPLAGAQGLQTNNPGWPGFSSGGWILGGTVYLSIPL